MARRTRTKSKREETQDERDAGRTVFEYHRGGGERHCFLQTEDSLTLNVQGDAASFSARVLGMNRVQGVENPVWQPLAAIHMADFTVAQSITKPSIYAVALSGLQGVKVVLDTVSGGKVTVFGRMGA